MRHKTYFSLLVLAALGCAALLHGAYSAARQEAIGNLLKQEALLAAQAAQDIEESCDVAVRLAESLAERPDIITLTSNGRSYIDHEYNENMKELLALTRMDEHGRILYSVPNNSVAGRDISGQPHVARFLETRRLTVSEIFTSVQGFRAVALHVPVFQQGRFRGSIGLLVNFDALTRKHLDDLRVADTGYAFAFSRDGVLIYTPVPGLTGKHYLEITKDFPDLRALIERMLRGETGTGRITFDRIREHVVERVTKQAAFTPVRLGDNFWSVCVATPESEILDALGRFGLYLVPLGLLVLLALALAVAHGLRHFVLEREMLRRQTTEAALKQSEERYRSVIEHMSDVFYQTDAKGRLIMVSPSGLIMAGNVQESEILGHDADRFWAKPEERRRLMELLRKNGEVLDYEVELRGPGGKSIFIATSSRVRRGPAGEFLGVEGTFRDITQRKRDLAALEDSARRFHSLFDNMAEGVALHSLVLDEHGQPVNFRIEEVNPSFEAIFNVRAQDVNGRLVTEAMGIDVPPFLEEYAIVASQGQAMHFETTIRPLGKQLSISATPWGDGGFAALFTDVTERTLMEEQLRHRALHDPLTGLANRSLCLDRIEQAMERARRRPAHHFAVAFMDLDRFKVINDSLGHEAGDQLLREVASRLLAWTRRMDTVCRYGGDEFALVLEELSAREVLRTLRRIRESLKQPVSIGDHKIQVEASFGVAYPPAQPTTPEEILRDANIALHRAKHMGRNRVVVYKPSMHEAAIQVMSLEHDIREGLAHNEFHMEYQPVFTLANSRLCGFEALLRWNHPQRGLVPPSEFIPVAEESGTIFQLGGFALARACADLAELRRINPAAASLTIAVNLSPRQFSRQGLSEQIGQALESSGLPPDALVLEITESSIMKHPEASAAILLRLKQRGVGIGIDDFGTGYSSMSALQRLPLDLLKIDMSFVRRLADSQEDREIVRAIVTLAKSLHLRCVAEGIETEEQLSALRELGCEAGQGYLCARPMPLGGIIRELDKRVCAMREE